MKTKYIATLLVTLPMILGCVRCNDYLAIDRISSSSDSFTVGIRATTTGNPSDPNSFGSSHEPGATGFLIEFFGKSLSTTLNVTNVRGTYSFADAPTHDLVMQPIGRSMPTHHYIIYATLTNCMVETSNRYVPRVLAYGVYNMMLQYDVNNVAFTSTGTVKYVHRSHWEKIQLGWKD